MNQINAIILDDENSNVELLSHLLDSYCPDVTIIAKCNTLKDAYRAIRSQEDSLMLFLDIELGGSEDSFHLLDLIKDRNDQVIFVSAFPKYAVKAFRYKVLDYITKPIRISDLVEAVRLASFRLLSIGNEKVKPEKVRIETYDKSILCKVDDIVYLYSENGGTVVFFNNNSSLKSVSRIGLFEERLATVDFLRVHKSYIINLNYVASIEYVGAGLSLLVGHDYKVPVSRRKKKELLILLNTV